MSFLLFILYTGTGDHPNSIFETERKSKSKEEEAEKAELPDYKLLT